MTTIPPYHPLERPPVPDPDALREKLYDRVGGDDDIHERVPERIRESEDPLEVPIRRIYGRDVTTADAIRRATINVPGSPFESLASTEDSRYCCSLLSHSQVLERSNRVVPPRALAALYRYGYETTSARINENGSVEITEIDADEIWEYRVMGFERYDPYEHYPTDYADRWFDDAEAVNAVSARVTKTGTEWGEYLKWFRSRPFKAYRLPAFRREFAAADVPSLPEDGPRIAEEFDPIPDPSVGDFVRWAILETLRETVPEILDIATGPGAWQTDRLSLVYDPRAGEKEYPDTAAFCHPVIFAKLSQLGYRPIDLYWSSPLVSHRRDYENSPRRIEFARGEPLADWFRRMEGRQRRPDRELVDALNVLPGFDWATYIPCARELLATPHELWERGELELSRA